MNLALRPLHIAGLTAAACAAVVGFWLMWHFDLPRAFAMNPLAVTMLALSPLLGAWKLGWQPRALRPLVATLAEPKFWLVLLPLYWIARNLPWWPFTLLAPGGMLS